MKIDLQQYFELQYLRRQGFSAAASAAEIGITARVASYWWRRPAPGSVQRKPLKKCPVRSARVKKRRQIVEKLCTTVVLMPRVRFTPVRMKKVETTVKRRPWNCPSRIRRKINSENLLGVGVRISESTIRRDLRALGRRPKLRRKVPPLTEDQRRKRKEFAAWCIKSKVVLIFTDEKLFRLNDVGGRHQWCLEDEEPDGKETSQGGESLWVWGAISKDFYVFVTLPRQSLNKEVYRNDILAAVLPELQSASRKGLVFQQDGAKAHAGAYGWLEGKGVRCLTEEWPAHSPDMSPIETLWSQMARAVSDMGPFSAVDLEEFVTKWIEEELTYAKVNRYVESFPKRCQKVIDADGRTIKP